MGGRQRKGTLSHICVSHGMTKKHVFFFTGEEGGLVEREAVSVDSINQGLAAYLRTVNKTPDLAIPALGGSVGGRVYPD